MEVIVLESESQVAELVSKRVQSLVKRKPKAVLGLATGASPMKIYEQLVQLYNQGHIDFSQVKAFNLDEYVGLGREHPASYSYYMEKHLFSHVNFKKENCFIPDGKNQDSQKECEQYEELLKKWGPVDLQLLGIGTDGHIGFNEPMSSFASRTRMKTLTKQTRKDNSIYFSSSEEIPYHVMTMGIASIMEAQEIVLIAYGEKKAHAVAAAVEGAVSASVPASILQHHPKVKVILDRQAASKLKNKDYYQWVFEKKPSWQKAEFS